MCIFVGVHSYLHFRHRFWEASGRIFVDLGVIPWSILKSFCRCCCRCCNTQKVQSFLAKCLICKQGLRFCMLFVNLEVFFCYCLDYIFSGFLWMLRSKGGSCWGPFSQILQSLHAKKAVEIEAQKIMTFGRLLGGANLQGYALHCRPHNSSQLPFGGLGVAILAPRGPFWHFGSTPRNRFDTSAPPWRTMIWGPSFGHRGLKFQFVSGLLPGHFFIEFRVEIWTPGVPKWFFAYNVLQKTTLTETFVVNF